MPEVNLTEPFSVVLADGRTIALKAGVQNVDQATADHWLVKAHQVGTPKGRMPVLQGEKGLKIEADEAGQRVAPVRSNVGYDNLDPPARQEGPLDWSHENPASMERAKSQAEEAGTKPVTADEQSKALAASTGVGPDAQGTPDKPQPAKPPAK